MKAIVFTEYGSPDVLHIEERPTPTPKDNEILVRVRAAAVNYGDTAGRNFGAITPRTFNMPGILWLLAKLSFGWNKPRKAIQILGNEFSGVVEAIGKDVTLFKVGDPVFGYCGPNFGAYAEYLCMREDDTVALKPANLSYEEAATVPYGSLMALGLLKLGQIQRGQQVLVVGASGGMGSYAVQLAKQYGAEVTGVCGTPHLDFVKALGADHVIDYTQEDFAHNGKTYDLIFDVLGRSSFAHNKKSLTPTGRVLYASFKTRQLLQMLWTSVTRRPQRVICAMTSATRDTLIEAQKLVEAGTLKTIVDRCYPMAQAADAHRYVEDGHKQGHVVITME